MTTVSVTTISRGHTVERIVFKQLGLYAPGAVEAALTATRWLSRETDELPEGITILIPQPTEQDLIRKVDVIRLGD